MESVTFIGTGVYCTKCTQLNPDDRYQNCDELMYALEHYDEMDENYRKKEKKKLTGFITVTAFSLVMFIAGIVFMFLSISENNRDYDSKINISTATDYNSKIAIYKEAINLYPYRTEAYIKMLEAYSDNNKFSDKESNEFMKYYNKSFAEKAANLILQVKDMQHLILSLEYYICIYMK